jgi:rare lipoprotein A
MFSNSRVRNVRLKIRAGHLPLYAPTLLSTCFRNVVQLLAVVLTAATLAACAQSSVVNNKTALRAADRRTSLVADNAKRHFIKHTRAAGTKVASYGLASFYSEGQQTANGEKFDPSELTAAHPNLPFGTRLRVTNVANGRSVTVRINDRGPFVAGRSVDVSVAAAERIGIVEQGVAKVKLDVIH